MEIVDPRLERDREVDEVVLPLADEHLLRLTQAPHLNEDGDHEDERDEGHHRPAECDPAGGRRQRVRHPLPQSSVKMIWYSAVLFAVFVSPATGSIFTFNVVRVPKDTVPRSRKTTVLVSPGLIRSMNCSSLIG